MIVPHAFQFPQHEKMAELKNISKQQFSEIWKKLVDILFPQDNKA